MTITPMSLSDFKAAFMHAMGETPVRIEMTPAQYVGFVRECEKGGIELAVAGLKYSAKDGSYYFNGMQIVVRCPVTGNTIHPSTADEYVKKMEAYGLTEKWADDIPGFYMPSAEQA